MAEDVRSLYLTALRNTHAMELQALQIMERQVDRLQNYPDVEQALRSHIAETHIQRDRLEHALQALDETPSALKEGVLGFVGNMAALAHTPASDEILKNAFANRAFENYEAGAYQSLLVIAKEAGHSQFLAEFQKSLDEEQRMAERVTMMIPILTSRFVARSLAGEPADR